jgi:glucose-1-phosphate cytidylyltransferase
MKKETQVVILCGGKGTRSYPFTEYFPKPMMPIHGKPILVHLMQIYAEQGFTSFVLAAGHRKEILYDYFGGRFPDWRITIVDTGAETDTGERLRQCAPYVGETFFANYGDAVGDIRLQELLDFHLRSGGLATLTSVTLRSQYGTVEADEQGRVRRFREKPVIPDQWINAGFFVFERAVFDLWNGTNLEGQVFPALVERGLVHTYRHEGFWKSVDTSKDQQELEAMYLRGEARWSTASAPAPRAGAAATPPPSE